MSDPSESHIILQACRALDAEADACGGSRRNWLRETASCARAEFLALFKRADESTRPADIVAARIEGLREAMAIKEKAAGSMLSYPGIGKETIEIRIVDGVKEANLINARIAELEATAPEMSEMRAKAEAFDAALSEFKKVNYVLATLVVEEALAEAKRKGAP